MNYIQGKEVWEAFLEDLSEKQANFGGPSLVSAAYAVDCPDHGCSAAVNETELFETGRFICEYVYESCF